MRFIDVINPIKWYAFLNGMALKKRADKLTEPYVIEQLLFRRMRCPECVQYGKCKGIGECKGCNCDTWGKMLLPEETCFCQRWPKMMDEEKWKEFKLNNNVKYFILYKQDYLEIP